ncbi:Beta-barrel assembly-enhancing protease [subsurface metagenome]
MDGGILTLVISGVALAGGAVGWLFRQYWYYRQAKKQAARDAGTILKERKTLLQEMLNEIEDTSQKEELRLQLDEVNTALLGLHSERLRRTLKAAGLPPEEALIADGLSQLQPQQVDQLKGEIAELQTLPQSDSIWDLIALGNAYYYAEQYEDAKDIYNRILKLHPHDPFILFNRGVAYGQLGRYYEALADFNRSLELSPNKPGSLTNRGNAYIELGMYDEALADLNRSLELRPDDPVTVRNLGCLYERLERYDEALTNFNRSLELRPDDPGTLHSRGIVYGKKKRYDDALADFNRSIEIKPDNAGPLYDLACLFSLQRKTDDALTCLKKAIEGDNKYREMAKTDKDFDNIRDDPRFKKLIESD